MKRMRDHLSPELFDPWEHLGPKRRRLLEIGWAGVFRESLLEHLPIHELADGFCDDRGHPSKDLSVALGALILQQLHDLTDQQTTEAVALNMAWHYALDIRHEPDAYLCERTLRNDRNRILESRLDEVLPARLDGPVNREGRIGHEPAAVGFDDGPVRDPRAHTVVCEACPDRDRCPTAAIGRSSSRYQYTHEDVQHRARRLHDASDEFRDRDRWRADVEATTSRFKHQMGMARLRIRGMKKVTFTARLRALGLNIHRVAAWKRTLATTETVEANPVPALHP